jgi:hypothetical protein
MERTSNTQTHEFIALRDAALTYLILSSDSFDADGDKTFGWRIGHSQRVPSYIQEREAASSQLMRRVKTVTLIIIQSGSHTQNNHFPNQRTFLTMHASHLGSPVPTVIQRQPPCYYNTYFVCLYIPTIKSITNNTLSQLSL